MVDRREGVRAVLLERQPARLGRRRAPCAGGRDRPPRRASGSPDHRGERRGRTLGEGEARGTATARRSVIGRRSVIPMPVAATGPGRRARRGRHRWAGRHRACRESMARGPTDGRYHPDHVVAVVGHAGDALPTTCPISRGRASLPGPRPGTPSMPLSGAGRSRGRSTRQDSGPGSTRPSRTRRPAPGCHPTVDVASGRAIRQQPVHDHRAGHRRLKIGWTYRDGVPAHGRQPRGEAARATHAFETPTRNASNSRPTLATRRRGRPCSGIGATFEGVLRHHTIMPDGSNRDSAFYGIIAPEWPAVRDRSRAKLAR